MKSHQSHLSINKQAGVMNGIEIPISDAANFLAKPGYQYRSLNSYHSSISRTHENVDGHPVGQHSTTIRLMKGAFN